jgi:hypothetical protein
VNSRCGDWIESVQYAMKMRRSSAGLNCPQSRSENIRTLRAREQALQQRAQVQTGSTHYDRQLASMCDVVDSCSRLPCVFAGGERLFRLRQVKQVMRNEPALLVSRLCGSNLKVPVNRD